MEPAPEDTLEEIAGKVERRIQLKDDLAKTPKTTKIANQNIV
jgi:hypothetical protein